MNVSRWVQEWFSYELTNAMQLFYSHSQHWQHRWHRPGRRSVRPPGPHVFLLLLPLLHAPQEQERDWQVLGRPEEKPYPRCHGQWPDLDGKLSTATTISATILNAAASDSTKPTGDGNGVYRASPAGNVLSRSKRLHSTSFSPFNGARRRSEFSSSLCGTISYDYASTNVCASTSSTASFTARELSGTTKSHKPSTKCVSRVK